MFTTWPIVLGWHTSHKMMDNSKSELHWICYRFGAHLLQSLKNQTKYPVISQRLATSHSWLTSKIVPHVKCKNTHLEVDESKSKPYSDKKKVWNAKKIDFHAYKTIFPSLTKCSHRFVDVRNRRKFWTLRTPSYAKSRTSVISIKQLQGHQSTWKGVGDDHRKVETWSWKKCIRFRATVCGTRICLISSAKLLARSTTWSALSWPESGPNSNKCQLQPHL